MPLRPTLRPWHSVCCCLRRLCDLELQQGTVWLSPHAPSRPPSLSPRLLSSSQGRVTAGVGQPGQLDRTCSVASALISELDMSLGMRVAMLHGFCTRAHDQASLHWRVCRVSSGASSASLLTSAAAGKPRSLCLLRRFRARGGSPWFRPRRPWARRTAAAAAAHMHSRSLLQL